MNSLLITVVILLGVGAITVGVLLSTGVIKTKSDEHKIIPVNDTPQSDDKTKSTCGDNYISPKPFEVGFINDSRHANANICSDKNNITYSIQQPYVDYDLPKFSNNCPCTEFVQPP